MMQLLPLMKMLVFLVRWDYTTNHLEARKGPKVSWNLNGRNRQKWDVHQVFCASRWWGQNFRLVNLKCMPRSGKFAA